ncbi:hypothetical protein V1511DRAFT_54991 [Dipodascopsis uninucleata]
MDVLSPAHDDVSAWICFDDYPSPTTPADDFLNTSVIGSGSASSMNSSSLLDLSNSFSNKFDVDLDIPTNHISFDWPSKADISAYDSDLTNYKYGDSHASLPM